MRTTACPRCGFGIEDGSCRCREEWQDHYEGKSYAWETERCEHGIPEERRCPDCISEQRIAHRQEGEDDE